MWRNVNKTLHLCKVLLPDWKPVQVINGKVATINLEEVVGHIYDKYFKESEDVQNKNSFKDDQFGQLLSISTNQKDVISPTTDDIWIFGYGSLVWKADFPFIDRRRGYIRGYQRRFYQNSIDHRGTYNKPGRVVTLLPTGKQDDRVYGMAYRISDQQKREVLQHLDYREKNGYERCTLEFQEFPEDQHSTRVNIIMYIATKDNESYAGHLPQLSLIAEQIFTSAGPSGTNREYLFNLANAMRVLFPGVDDEHLFELEKRVVKRIQEDEPEILERSLKSEIANIILKEDERKTTPKEKEEDEVIDQALDDFKNLRIRCTMPGWKEIFLAKELTQERNSVAKKFLAKNEVNEVS